MKNQLTEAERKKLHKNGTIHVKRGNKSVRVDASDGGVITFDYRYRTLAAALAH